jgi:hypothetical protein
MQTTTYISIDVATRSLAIGVYRMKPFVSMDSYKDANPVIMNDNLNGIITPILMDVFDINDGAKTKETSAEAKAISLKRVLERVDIDIAASIVMFYAGRYPIEVIPPSWKNTICVHPLLSHSRFLGYCTSNYLANKNHCKYSMIYLLTLTDHMDMIQSIRKKNHDDIADTLCQALARHLKQ